MANTYCCSVAAFTGTVYFFFLKSWMKDYGLSDKAISYAYPLTTVCSIIARIISGYLLDKLGKKGSWKIMVLSQFMIFLYMVLIPLI